MKIKYIMPCLGMLALISLSTVTISCSGSDDDKTQQPTVNLALTAFSPATGVAGSNIEITGTGFGDDQSKVTVKFNNVVAANIVYFSATRIIVEAPAAATGTISVIVGDKTQSFTNNFTYVNEIDVTAKILNPSFEENIDALPASWYVSHTGMAWQTVNTDGDATKTGANITGIWHPGIPDYQLSQSIDGLDNGRYRVTCNLFVGANAVGSRLTTQRLFAANKSTLFGAQSNYSGANLAILESLGEQVSFAGLTQTVSDTGPFVEVVVTDVEVTNGSLTFGIRTNGTGNAAGFNFSAMQPGSGWFKVDNFHLYYLGR
ncbi:hypothetical protein GR160_09800 [Flavobacterium sp. Sd200]|uniref:IPT/TIG domain-containing protein n=1 Tax=Flavobacterium sp. Sd200 TaxID=2692211 RepID=UPI00136C8C04|nr:IPT/TIG domain-containing protein [Flavobacterium sp. Sd200]MXN91521.1 hypothetical protein [Flavobacterium sp. Sd200]